MNSKYFEKCKDTQRHTETHKDTQRHTEAHRDAQRHLRTSRKVRHPYKFWPIKSNRWRFVKPQR